MAQHAIVTACTLSGEFEQLQEVVADLSDHGRKRSYAQWLIQRNDPRGQFLQSVLDDWDAGKDVLAADESIAAVWRDTCGVTLLQKLREGKLDSQAFAICSAARPALVLTPALAVSEAPVGATKFGGKPDLPSGISWPEFDGKLHTFIGQFRLEDLQPTQAGRQLPRTGLLSFFVFDDPIETGQPAALGAEGAWRVIYAADSARLRRCDPPQEFDEGNRLAPECVLKMQETLDLPNVNTYLLDNDYGATLTACRRARAMGLSKERHDAYEAILAALTPEREERSHLMGWSHPQVLLDDPVAEDFRHLLTVASEELLDWTWADGHQLFFSIRPDDLASGDFDRVDITDG